MFPPLIKSIISGLVHTYPFSFENATFFIRVFKKIHVHTRTGRRRFRKVAVWRLSSKNSVFGDRFIVYVWTDGQSVKKKLRFQKYPDTGVDVASPCVIIHDNL